MRNYKKALKHINKEELSTKKIELSNINKLNAGIKKVERDLKQGQKFENQYKKLTGEADDLARKFLAFSSDTTMGIGLSVNLNTIIKEIIAAGKELGVNMANNKDVKFAQNVMAAWAEWNKDTQKLSDKASAYAKKLQ